MAKLDLLMSAARGFSLVEHSAECAECNDKTVWVVLLRHDATKIFAARGELIIRTVTPHQRMMMQHMINMEIITNLKIKTHCRWRKLLFIYL